MRNRVYTILLSFFLLSYAQAEPILKDIQGQNIPFSSLKGKWVIINYWASWCPSCLHEISAFNQFYKKNKEKVALYAVNYEELSLSKQKDLIKKYKMNYPSLAEDPSTTLNIGEIIGLPVTFIFTPQGTLAKTLYGEQTYAHLTDVLAMIEN